LLEQPNLALDLALDNSFSDFKEAQLPPDFTLERLQGGQWQWHRHPRDKD
jgi:steroid 5-alpha reductase family enzyme